MATYLIRPTSQYLIAQGNPLWGGGASLLASMNDNSDGTYGFNSGNSGLAKVGFNLAAPSVPSTEFVARIGQSMRWKGDTAGLYGVGVQVARSTDGTPTVTTTLVPNNSAAFTTTEIAQALVTWSNAECNSLRLWWADYRFNTVVNQTNTADIWATVYSIAPGTASPSTYTSAVSTPVVPVALSVVVGWEASVSSANLLKVLTEIRIESGGTGVGTGTLVATGNATTTLTATAGTQTPSVNVTASNALPNGTYKVYARNYRYRDNGTANVADQYGAWSAAGTITQSAPIPTAPTVTTTTDQVNDRIAVGVSPVSTAGFSSPTIDIQRSDDGGTTWNAVRFATGISGTFGSVTNIYDHEAPRATAVQYRARVSATNTGVIYTSNWTTVYSVTSITADTWNLKCPENPTLNFVDVTVTGETPEDINEDMGVFRPIGATYATVVSGTLSGWDGNLTIRTLNSAEWEKLKGLLTAQKVLMLETPYGVERYIRIVGGAKTIQQGTPTSPRRVVGLSYVETAAP